MKYWLLLMVMALPVEGAVFVTLDRPEVTFTEPLTLGQIASVRATAMESVSLLVNLPIDIPLNGKISKIQVQQQVADKGSVLGLDLVRIGRCQDGWKSRIAADLKKQIEVNLAIQQRISEIKVYGQRCPWIEEGKVIAIDILTERLSRRVRISLELETQHRLSLIAELSFEQLQPVLMKDVPERELLSRSDFKWQWQSVPNLFSDVFELQGRQTKRVMRKGSVLTHENTEVAPDYRQGEEVSVIYQKGAIRIETKGILLSSGMLKERVRVRLVETGAVINVQLEREGVGYALD